MSGHDFIRAASALDSRWALAPAGSLSGILPETETFSAPLKRAGFYRLREDSIVRQAGDSFSSSGHAPGFPRGGALNNPLKRLLKPVWVVFRDALPAKAHVVLDQLRFHGGLPNLRQPATFSEKIAHRMLYDRDPRIPPLVDKIAAKEQMAARFDAEFIIPTLAAFDSATQVGFATLPYPCVIKPNHASGFNLFLDAAARGRRQSSP